jgi:iron-sulfur cluster assembly protein
MDAHTTPQDAAPAPPAERPAEKTLSISVSPRAVLKAKEALAKRGTPNAMLRLGVRGGGCSGFGYVIEFADEPGARDRVFEFDGLKVLVDPKSLVLLNGSTLDYETKLMGHGFKFVNPNEKTACGCGESFTV